MTSRALARGAWLLSLGLLLGPARAAVPLFDFASAPPSYSQADPIGICLEGWSYPYPVRLLQFEQAGQTVRMAYMDVRPDRPNGHTLLLLHGRHFSSDYWVDTLRTFASYGYRVIAPDQIGFGKSSKPEFRYTLAQQVDNTVGLLDHLRLDRVSIIAHDMGALVAVQLARRQPQRLSALILENPLGLAPAAAGSSVPAAPVHLDLKQSVADYRKFLKGQFQQWRPEYERFVERYARLQFSADFPRLARVAALTGQMLAQASVRDELPRLNVPTLLVVGQQDGQFGAAGGAMAFGREAQRRIPGAVLKEFANAGHVPHMEAPERFQAVVTDFIYGRK